MITRLGLGLLGLAAGAFGASRLLADGWSNLFSALLWLAGGVVAHDGLVAPLTLALVLVGRRLVPRAWRTVVTPPLVLLVLVTVTAVPQLGRFGARLDNTTLLDRDYTAGWLVLAALVLLGALARALWLRRAATRG